MFCMWKWAVRHARQGWTTSWPVDCPLRPQTDAAHRLCLICTLPCRGVKRKASQAQLDAVQRRDRDRTGRFMPLTAEVGSPPTGPEFRGRVTGAFDGGYLATVR